MNFALWSGWHWLYICSPFLLFALICCLLRGRGEKTKHFVGFILGSVSVLILVVRNVDIYARSGWGVEVIPLQVCHIGSLVAGFALILRKKWLMLTSFCFHLIPAVLAMVFADALVNYDTLLKIRPQTYIWGHILIVICALYAVVIYRPRLEKRDLYVSLGFTGVMAAAATVCNSLFRAVLHWEPNYFYLFNYKGTPLKFLYTVFPSAVYGWFEINWLYTLTLMAVFVAAFIGMYYLAKYIAGRNAALYAAHD